MKKLFILLLLLASGVWPLAVAQNPPIVVGNTQIQRGVNGDCLYDNAGRVGVEPCGGSGSGTVSSAAVGDCGIYSAATTIGGYAGCQYIDTALSTPTAPVVTPVCTAAGMETCSTTYTYVVVAFNIVGNSAPSVAVTITNGPDMLSMTNHVSIATAANTGSTYCGVWKTAGPDAAFFGRIDVSGTLLCSQTLTDIGQAITNESLNGGVQDPLGYSQVDPWLNTSSGAYLAGAYRIGGPVSLGDATPGIDPSPNENASNILFGLQRSSNSNVQTQVSSEFIIDAGAGAIQFEGIWNGLVSKVGNTHTIPYAFALDNEVVHRANSTMGTDANFPATAAYQLLENEGPGTIQGGAALYGQCQNAGVGTMTKCASFWAAAPLNTGGGVFTTYFGNYAEASGGVAVNPYPLWTNDQGVCRIKADNTFDSVYQGIFACYNPLVTKYVPGASNFERIVIQWETNVAVIGPEKGGSGTLRGLELTGSSLKLDALSGGAGALPICVSSTGVLSLGTNVAGTAHC